MATTPPAAGARRSWPRRLLIAANIAVAVCVLAVASAYGYFRYQYGQIPKFSLGHILNPGSEDPPPPGEPFNVLVVGSDTRATIDPSEKKSFGSTKQVGGQRSDVTIVLRVDPKRERAAMLSIPRDLYVPLAGTEGRCERGLRCGRINEAFDAPTPEAGAARLIATIQDNLGIDIDHYVQVDFNGFRAIVEAVGGVDMFVATRVRDSVSGLNISNPGCVTFDGNMALAWVRSRNYQYVENGRWKTDPTADLGRIQRQQDFIQRALKKAIRKGAKNPVTLKQLIDAGVRNVAIDDGLEPEDMYRIASQFRNLEPGQVEMYTIPNTAASRNGAAVLLVDEPEASQVIDKFLGVQPEPGEAAPPPGVVPNEVSMRVLNGSGKGGQVGEASAALRELGYTVLSTGNAESFKFTASEIRYGRGQEHKARLVQSHVGGQVKLREDITLRGVDVVLITGSQFAGIVTADAPPEPPTTAEEPKGDEPEEPTPDPAAEC